MNKKPPKISGKKKKRRLSKREQNERLRTRLKDAVWSMRQQYIGMPVSVSIDRVMPYLAFGQKLSQDQLNGLFPDYPSRIPEDFQMAVISQIRSIIQAYWNFTQQGIGHFIKVYKTIIALEHIVRDGFGAYILIEDKVHGFQLAPKPKDWQ